MIPISDEQMVEARLDALAWLDAAVRYDEDALLVMLQGDEFRQSLMFSALTSLTLALISDLARVLDVDHDYITTTLREQCLEELQK